MVQYLAKPIFVKFSFYRAMLC